MESVTGAAVSTALQAKRLRQELKNMQAVQTRDTNQAEKFFFEANESIARMKKTNQELQLLRLAEPKAQIDANIAIAGGELLGWAEKAIGPALGIGALTRFGRKGRNARKGQKAGRAAPRSRTRPSRNRRKSDTRYRRRAKQFNTGVKTFPIR